MMRPMSDFSSLVEFCGDALLNDEGALIGGYHCEGVNIDGLDYEEKRALSGLAEIIHSTMPVQVAVHSVLAHHEDGPLCPVVTDDEIYNVMATHRARGISDRGVYKTRLATFLEVYPRSAPGTLLSWSGVQNLMLSPFDNASWKATKQILTSKAALNFEIEEINHQRDTLESALIQAQWRWHGLAHVASLDKRDLWSWCRFLATLDPSVFHQQEDIPDHDVSSCLASTDIRPVKIGGESFMKTGGVRAVYAKIGQVIGITENPLHGVFASLPKVGNKVIASRFKPYTDSELYWAFFKRRRELERKSFRVSDLWRWQQQMQEDFDPHTLRKVLAQKFEQLEDAEAARVRYGSYHCVALVFDNDASRVIRAAKELDEELKARGLRFAWQDVGMDRAFAAAQPGGKSKSLLDFAVSEVVASETLPFYASPVGDRTVDCMDGKPALIPLEHRSGVPYLFDPFANGRYFVIGDGPSGHGKTTFKLLLTTYVRQYDPICRALDVDPGTEFLAGTYGDDAEVFRFEDDGIHGFNVMAGAEDADDLRFRAHLAHQVSSMLKANESPEMQHFTQHEQVEFDENVDRVLRFFDRSDWRLSRVAAYCGLGVKRKLARWIYADSGKGFYAPLFDCLTEVDKTFRSSLAVWNLKKLQDDHHALPVMMSEIVYRVMREFKDPRLINILKLLDIDEAHHILGNQQLVTDLIKPAFLQGRKNMFGVTLWSQSAEHFASAKWWRGIRDQVTAFVFFANSKIVRDLYRQAYGLTDGEIDAISRMTPMREIYIVQRDKGVSGVFQVNLSDVERVITTSTPRNVTIRNSMMDRLVPDMGVEGALLEISRHIQGAENADITRRKRAART